jgi:NAD-dependent dihydropyrimidine dehydrogenase PreA subunit
MSVDPKSLEGTFIDVEVDDSIVDDAALASKLAEVCPVDIFAADGGRVAIVSDNLDECVLLYLCVDAAHAVKIRIVNLFH